MNNNTTIPNHYDGREQALIKHILLESYLERLLMIVGIGAKSSGRIELCYVDCFAGPWGDDSECLEGTSIAISLKTMSKCAEALRRLGVSATMKALFVERDSKAFQRLKTYLNNNFQDIQTHCLHGDFVDLRDQILTWCGRHAFAFFFIDPKGWKSVGVSVLHPLLKRPHSEFLINFMYDFINRTASMHDLRSQIVDFLGCEEEETHALREMPPEQREEHQLNLYRKGLCKNAAVDASGRITRTACVRVLDPEKNRPKYHLIYMTRHPKGIVKFMEISEKLDLIQRQIRAIKKHSRREEQTRIKDLFGEESYSSTSAETSDVDDEVDAFWLQYLNEKEPVKIGEEQMAEFMESTGWMPGDYQASLLRLIKDGHVKNIDAHKPRRTKPLHYEKNGERLILLKPSEPANYS